MGSRPHGRASTAGGKTLRGWVRPLDRSRARAANRTEKGRGRRRIMESIRTVDIQELRARVARAEYVVDADAVAEAIVRRAMGSRAERGAANSARPFDADGTGTSRPSAA